MLFTFPSWGSFIIMSTWQIVLVCDKIKTTEEKTEKVIQVLQS